MCNEDRPFWSLPDRTMFYRNCPSCQGLMEYDHKGTRNRANRTGNSCQSCSIKQAWKKRKANKEKEKTHFRSCPTCSNKIGHKSVRSRDNAVRTARECYSCAQTGKTMSVQARAKIGAAHKGKIQTSEATAKMIATKKIITDTWVKLYGVKSKLKQLPLRKWGKQIQERDDHQCQCCGAEKTTPRSMHAHHIVPKEYFPELSDDLSNGITLCASCHSALHADLDRVTVAGTKLDAEGFVAHASNFINPSVPLSSSVLKEDDSNARA